MTFNLDCKLHYSLKNKDTNISLSTCSFVKAIRLPDLLNS